MSLIFYFLQKEGPLKARAWKRSASCKVLSTDGWSKGLGASVGSQEGTWHTLHACAPLIAFWDLVIRPATPCASQGR